MYSRILFSLFSHNFITTDLSCDIFKDILARIDKAKEKNNRIVFDENKVQKDEFKPFTK